MFGKSRAIPQRARRYITFRKVRVRWRSFYILLALFPGPFQLHEHLYNTRTGSVFRVTDAKSNEYSLKVFTYGPELPLGHKERRLYDYANERDHMVNITRLTCPDLLDALGDKTKFGSSVECADHHVQILLGLDVPVSDGGVVQGGEVVIATPRKMLIRNQAGDESERMLDFSANTLLPYMAGGRLSDLVTRVPKYQSMVVRYPLYVDVAPQMVEAVRFMHSLHIVHLGIQTSTILCSNVACEHAILSDPSSAWDGAPGTSSAYANELMQQSVRFSQFAAKEDDEEKENGGNDEKKIRIAAESKSASNVTHIFADYLTSPSWEGTMKVDWYGLGGALFYILAGIRPVAEDRTGANSHDAAEFIYRALQSKQLLSKIPSQDAKKALMKIRDQVTEGLLLVDGLLQADRSLRISFDAPKMAAQMKKTANNLRSSKALMSALQTDSSVGGSSCAAFIANSAKSSETLAALPVHDELPSFLQQICH